jgi:hypothetical protein
VGLQGQFTLNDPEEEGLTWAVRLGFSRTGVDLTHFGLSLPVNYQGVKLGDAGIQVSSQTFTPQLVAGRRLDFAEPYFGIGLEWTEGWIKAPLNFPAFGISETLSTPRYSAVGAIGFLGTTFHLPPTGLFLSMEMGWSSLGCHRMGVMIGASF